MSVLNIIDEIILLLPLLVTIDIFFAIFQFLLNMIDLVLLDQFFS